jgi:chaperonin cofactor prefoldin
VKKSDFRLLEENVQQLCKTVQSLRQQLDSVSEQVDAVDTEVRLRLSTTLEENQLLQFRADPYSLEGTPLGDIDDFCA